jgi:hypothetical protein
MARTQDTLAKIVFEPCLGGSIGECDDDLVEPAKINAGLLNPHELIEFNPIAVVESKAAGLLGQPQPSGAVQHHEHGIRFRDQDELLMRYDLDATRELATERAAWKFVAPGDDEILECEPVVHAETSSWRANRIVNATRAARNQRRSARNLSKTHNMAASEGA